MYIDVYYLYVHIHAKKLVTLWFLIVCIAINSNLVFKVLRCMNWNRDVWVEQLSKEIVHQETTKKV